MKGGTFNTGDQGPLHLKIRKGMWTGKIGYFGRPRIRETGDTKNMGIVRQRRNKTDIGN